MPDHEYDAVGIASMELELLLDRGYARWIWDWSGEQVEVWLSGFRRVV